METEAKEDALGGESWLPALLHAQSWVRAATAAHGHAHSQSCWPWSLSSLLTMPMANFWPLLSSTFRLCCSSTVVQQGRVGEGRRKKFGVVVLQKKKKKKKSEKTVLQGLGMLVVLPLPLLDPPFQARMRKLLRTALSQPLLLWYPRAQEGDRRCPARWEGEQRGQAAPKHTLTHAHLPASFHKRGFFHFLQEEEVG